MLHVAGGDFRIGIRSPVEVRPSGAPDGASRVLVENEAGHADPAVDGAIAVEKRFADLDEGQCRRRKDEKTLNSH